jgi:hypothetical protein
MTPENSKKSETSQSLDSEHSSQVPQEDLHMDEDSIYFELEFEIMTAPHEEQILLYISDIT